MGDFRNTIAGPGLLGNAPTGGGSTGELEYFADRDVFLTRLINGLTYTIEQLGSTSGNGSLFDPFLRLFNVFNTEVASDDDSGLGFRDSLINFTPTNTGNFFLQAGAFNDNGLGTYKVRVSEGLGSLGNDVITGTTAADAINGNDGNDAINGSDGNDTIRGGRGNDTILGGNGNDVLLGGEDFDFLRGQAGNDVIQGGFQVDVMVGGTGNDIFDFDSGAGSNPAQRDAIRAGDGAIAFQGAGGAAGDRIDLSGIDARATTGFNDAFVFGGNGIGRISLVNAGVNTIVRGNTDNDAAFEFEVLIEDGAVNALAYTAADFIL